MPFQKHCGILLQPFGRRETTDPQNFDVQFAFLQTLVGFCRWIQFIYFSKRGKKRSCLVGSLCVCARLFSRLDAGLTFWKALMLSLPLWGQLLCEEGSVDVVCLSIVWNHTFVWFVPTFKAFWGPYSYLKKKNTGHYLHFLLVNMITLNVKLHELLKDDITGCKQQRRNCASHQLKLKKQQAPSWLQERGSCRALEASWPFLPQTQHPPPLFTSLSPLRRLPVCLFRGIYTLLRTGQPGFLQSGPGWAAHHWPVSRGLFGVAGDAAGGGA